MQQVEYWCQLTAPSAQITGLRSLLDRAEKQLAKADAELESLRQVPERIVTLSDRIKEDEEAAALLQMEETRRATGVDIRPIVNKVSPFF